MEIPEVHNLSLKSRTMTFVLLESLSFFKGRSEGYSKVRKSIVDPRDLSEKNGAARRDAFFSLYVRLSFDFDFIVRSA